MTIRRPQDAKKTGQEKHLLCKKTVIRITIPRARHQDRPIHLGANPFGNTYLRKHEGDYKADDETVKRMLAECVEDSRDERILKHLMRVTVEQAIHGGISDCRNRRIQDMFRYVGLDASGRRFIR